MNPSLSTIVNSFIQDLEQVKIRPIRYCSSFEDYRLWGSLWNLSEFYQSLIENRYSVPSNDFY